MVLGFWFLTTFLTSLHFSLPPQLCWPLLSFHNSPNCSKTFTFASRCACLTLVIFWVSVKTFPLESPLVRPPFPPYLNVVYFLLVLTMLCNYSHEKVFIIYLLSQNVLYKSREEPFVLFPIGTSVSSSTLAKYVFNK